MSDLAEQQAAFAELFTELALQRLHPKSVLRQPAPPSDLKQTLERINEAMFTMYSSRRD
ncbi:hypothetical protein [Dankookia rubra]|uniref:hypothetical protein n=1 Tax=Dankookia rubra TaxID=1442381 RepID=UPI00140E16B8|nr:hypothetical protein [Dankookia rubra]